MEVGDLCWPGKVKLILKKRVSFVRSPERQSEYAVRVAKRIRRGRVSAVNFLFIGASNQLGEFESGVAAALIGAVGAALFGGVAAVIVVAIWAIRFPELRRADSFHLIEERS